MSVCYFCATPLHILHAVNLKLTAHEAIEADMVVYTHFADAPRTVEVLSRLGLFRRVMLYDNHTLTYGGKLNRLYHAFVPDALLRSWRRDFPYDEVVFFALDPLTMTRLMAWGGGCRFYYGEDGIGSYINPRLYTPSPITRTLLGLTGRLRYLADVAGIYLHRPALRVFDPGFPAVAMDSLPATHPAMRRVMEALWPVDETAIDTTRPVMYFEEPLHELFGGDALAAEAAIPRLAAEIFGETRVYIKRHPRMTPGAADRRYLPCNAPYERVMGLWQAEHTALISAISTAALQPLLLCGGKPYMLFFYRLLLPAGAPAWQLWDTFFDKLRTAYGLEQRLLLPTTEAELKEAMAAIAAALAEGDNHGNEAGNTKE